MSILSGRLAVALALAALCLGPRIAHAQATPVSYWLPSWPLGFGGHLASGPGSNTYGDFPSFDGRGGRTNFSNGWFVGAESRAVGLGMNGINQDAGFGMNRALYSEGVQFGYNFENTRGLPLTVFAGFNTLKYNPGIGSPFAAFDSTSVNVPGYTAHAGVEFQPAPNLSLSLGFGYTQQSGDINSLVLPGASPFGSGVRR
jgi:opacity protein-like surface antigen